MKKIALIFVLVSGLLQLAVEFPSRFKKTKLFYSAFYPEKYFSKDELKYRNKIPVDGNVGTGLYYYEGELVKRGLLKRVMWYESGLEEVSNKKGDISVWYNKITRSIMIRNSENPPKWYSFDLLNAWMPMINWILWFPALFYYLYIRKKEKQA